MACKNQASTTVFAHTQLNNGPEVGKNTYVLDIIAKSIVSPENLSPRLLGAGLLLRDRYGAGIYNRCLDPSCIP